MSSKFWFLMNESLKKKTKSKWFIVANIIICFALIIVCNIDRVITYFGGDFTENKEIILIDDTGYANNLFKSNLENTKNVLNMDYSINIEDSTSDIEEVKEEIKDTSKIIVVLENDEVNYLKAKIISNSYIDTSYYQYLYQILNNVKMEVSLMKSNIDIEEYQKVTSSIKIDREILDTNETNSEEMINTVMSTVFPTIILPFYILMVLLVQMIGTEINEEKSSRSMEIIISNVSPGCHFASKIVAGNLFVTLQTVLLFLYGIIGLVIRNITGGGSLTGELGTYVTSITSTLSTSGVMDELIIIIPLTIILILLSFLTYSLVAGILASMTVSMEDFQQIQTPIMLISFVGYYLAVMSGLFNGSLLIKILSYIPFLSAMLSPALFITSQIGIIDIIISIVITIIFNYILIKVGLKIYKIGILNYSEDKMWSKIFKAFKENS